jgi:hypothetical protein
MYRLTLIVDFPSSLTENVISGNYVVAYLVDIKDFVFLACLLHFIIARIGFAFHFPEPNREQLMSGLLSKSRIRKDMDTGIVPATT